MKVWWETLGMASEIAHNQYNDDKNCPKCDKGYILMVDAKICCNPNKNVLRDIPELAL